MSFYRTYRPQVIDEIDNAKVREQLLALLSKDRKELPHAYFFTGPKGTGKTTAARVIAKLFNCVKLTKSGPCGTCEQCMSISNGTSMDVVEMDAASNRGIDEIRLLRERIGLSPVSSTYTIYIIDEVHMLTTEAFNALLKTLEEPPAHAVFVLATTDAHKVPATITSRCMILRFAKASKTELLHALTRVVTAEKISISDEALGRIAELSDGAFRDAVKFLEQVSFHKGKIELEHIDAALSLSTGQFVAGFVSYLDGKDASQTSALAQIKAAAEEGMDMRTLITDVLLYLRANLIGQINGTVSTPVVFADREKLQRAMFLFTKAYGELRYTPIPELPLELAVIELFAVPAALTHEKQGPKAPPTGQTLPAKPVQPSAAPSAETPVKAAAPAQQQQEEPAHVSLGLLTLDKLVEHWPDFIAATKPENHSIAGVLRSSRPKSVEDGIVCIEAFYKFHQEKLADIRTKQLLADVLKKLFGEKVKIEIVLGKK
jgi:DNA polymerase-3 subunit gamma/tau